MPPQPSTPKAIWAASWFISAALITCTSFVCVALSGDKLFFVLIISGFVLAAAARNIAIEAGAL